MVKLKKKVTKIDSAVNAINYEYNQKLLKNIIFLVIFFGVI
jgi:hypothetical protein